jgi:hypothetical protein
MIHHIFKKKIILIYTIIYFLNNLHQTLILETQKIPLFNRKNICHELTFNKQRCNTITTIIYYVYIFFLFGIQPLSWFFNWIFDLHSSVFS